MSPRLVVAGFCVALLPALGGAQVAAPDSARAATRAAVERHVRFLAADSLKGRQSGTAGWAIAAHYVVTAFDEIKAMPAVPTTTCDASGRCEWTYFQPVRSRRPLAPGAQDLARNIVAVVPGTDTAMADQWVIVGASVGAYSYNGYGNVTAKDVPTPGADDNASGMAAVLELARRFSAAPLRRPVVFVLFAEFVDGYESFLDGLQRPAESIVAMFNLHTVGRLNSGRLEIDGTSTSRSWRPIIDSVSSGSTMRVVTGATFSATEPFTKRGVPTLRITTGTHRDLMGPLDNADRIDYDGLVRVVEFSEQLIRYTGNGVRPWRGR